MNQTDLNEYYPEVATAAVDICGLKYLVNRSDECKSAMKAIELLVKNVFLQKGVYKEVPPKGKPDLFLYDFETYFGDSVYLFADPNLDIVTQLDRLTISCASILATGFQSGFMVRVGISVGDLCRKVIDLGGGNKRDLRIGTCMIRSHQLQECQRWVGGAVQTQFPTKDYYRFEYDVPIKKDSEYEGHILQSINWVCLLKKITTIKTNKKTYQNKNEIIDQVSKVISEVTGASSKEIAIRLENTIKFIDYVFNNDYFINFE
ncbi:hypothetical protein ACFLVB_01760 [Chloroflexota bacterium]